MNIWCKQRTQKPNLLMTEWKNDMIHLLWASAMWTFCWKTSGGWITLWIPWLETPPAVDCIAFTFCNWSWTPRLFPPREEPHVTTLPSLRIAANASFVAWTSCTSVSLWMVGWVCTRCSCLGWGHDAKNSVRNCWAHVMNTGKISAKTALVWSTNHLF